MTKAKTKKQAPIISTHGAACEYIGADGVKRKMRVGRFADGTLQFQINTYWDGIDKVPMTTGIRLGTEACSSLVSLLIEFMTNMDKYKQEAP